MFMSVYMYTLLIFGVLLHLCHAQQCHPPVIKQKIESTWEESGVRHAELSVNITSRHVNISGVSLALELPPGGSIKEIWELSPTSGLQGVYEFPTWRVNDGLNAGHTHTFGFIFTSASYQDLNVSVHLLSVTCSGGSEFLPKVKLCDNSNYTTCVDVAATRRETECYSLFSFFNNKASSLNVTTTQGSNLTCIKAYDQQNCEGSHVTFKNGAVSLTNHSFNNKISSLIFSSSCDSTALPGDGSEEESSSSEEESYWLNVQLDFCTPTGFPYQEHHFTVILQDKNGNFIDEHPHRYLNINISSGGTINRIEKNDDDTFEVYFSVTGCGVYKITIDSCADIFGIPDREFYFEVTEKPAPQICDIYQHGIGYCEQRNYPTAANISIGSQLTFCCEPTDTLQYDKRQVFAYNGVVGCTSHSEEISRTTIEDAVLTFCQLDDSNTQNFDFTMPCSSHLVFSPSSPSCNGTANCNENPPPTCGAMERLFILDTDHAEPCHYKDKSQIYMCCPLPPPSRPAFRMGYVYTYDSVATHLINSSYPSGNGTKKNDSATHNVDIRGKIHVLPVCVEDYLVISTISFSNFKCNATTTYRNGTKTINRKQIDEEQCKKIDKELNNRSGDRYFYITQDVNTGQIVNVLYKDNQLALAQARVNMLRGFDFEISPHLTEFEPDEEDKRRKRDINDESWNCWYRKSHDEASGRVTSGEKRVCINQLGVHLVESTDTFSFGSEAAFSVNENEKVTAYDGIPIYGGHSYSLVMNSDTETATPASITRRGFKDSEAEDYERLNRNKRNVRKQRFDWDGFREEIPEEPANIELYIYSELRTTFQVPSQTQSFLTVSKLVTRYPIETGAILWDYVQKNPNGSISIDKMIFGAIAHAYTEALDNIILNMLNAPMSTERKSVLLNAIALIRGDRISDVLVSEMNARTELPDAEGFAATNILSIIAGQMYHVGKSERAAPLLDTIERKLVESEDQGDENGILHGLHSLGNTHSRRGAPHLIRYLNPEVPASNDMRVHLHKAAAHGLRGVPGTDITEVLVRSLSVHSDEVTKTIKRSLVERRRNAKQVERALSKDNMGSAAWLFERTWGNDNGNVNFYTAADWKLSFESTRLEAITGFRIRLFETEFDVMEGGAFIGTTGYAAFAVHLYFQFEIPNPIPFFGGRIIYVLFNWGIRLGRELPIRENRDICVPVDDSFTGWTGIISLPTFPIFYATITVYKVLSASVFVSADLFMQYKYEFNFKNGLTTNLADIQFRTTVDPGGEVNALFIGGGNIGVIEAHIASNINLMRITLPFTYNVILDGSGTCKAIHFQGNFLRGNVVAGMSLPVLCLFTDCTWETELTNWPGYSYYETLEETRCCSEDSASQPGSDGPGRNMLQPRVPVGFIPINGTSSFVINGGRTTVTWENVNGIDRPVQALTTIGNCNANGCPGAQGTNVAAAIRTALGQTGEYTPPLYHAGHILGAILGGSNNDILNFFIQRGAINSGPFRTGFELSILNCLKANSNYYARMALYFYYTGAKVATPSAYTGYGLIMYQNGTKVPTYGIDNTPVGCIWPPTAAWAGGQANLVFYEDSN